MSVLPTNIIVNKEVDDVKSLEFTTLALSSANFETNKCHYQVNGVIFGTLDELCRYLLENKSITMCCDLPIKN